MHSTPAARSSRNAGVAPGMFRYPNATSSHCRRDRSMPDRWCGVVGPQGVEHGIPKPLIRAEVEVHAHTRRRKPTRSAAHQCPAPDRTTGTGVRVEVRPFPAGRRGPEHAGACVKRRVSAVRLLHAQQELTRGQSGNYSLLSKEIDRGSPRNIALYKSLPKLV